MTKFQFFIVKKGKPTSIISAVRLSFLVSPSSWIFFFSLCLLFLSNTPRDILSLRDICISWLWNNLLPTYTTVILSHKIIQVNYRRILNVQCILHNIVSETHSSFFWHLFFYLIFRHYHTNGSSSTIARKYLSNFKSITENSILY